jgi:hypothetical protein
VWEGIKSSEEPRAVAYETIADGREDEVGNWEASGGRKRSGELVMVRRRKEQAGPRIKEGTVDTGERATAGRDRRQEQLKDKARANRHHHFTAIVS